MWDSECKPSDSKSVPIYISKKKKIQEWLIQATENSVLGRCPILALVGPSGSGKSTLVELLCAEMGSISLVSWTDDMLESDVYKNTPLEHDMLGSSALEHDFTPSWAKPKGEQLVDFMLRSSYNPLQLTTTSTATATNDTLAKKLSGRSGFKTTSASSDAELNARRSILLLHDPPLCNTQLTNGRKNNSSDEWWNILIARNIPVILIISLSNSKDDTHYHSDRFIAKSVQESIQLETVYVPPITSPNIIKILKWISVKKELLNHRTSLAASKASNNALEQLIEHISLTCQGDIRQAILQFQITASSREGNDQSTSLFVPPAVADLADLRHTDKWDRHLNASLINPSQSMGAGTEVGQTSSGLKRKGSEKKTKSSDSTVTTVHSHSRYARDNLFTNMHSVGKVLYAKLDGNGYFLPSFDCDQVVAVSDMDVSMLFLFTQWNCIGIIDGTFQTISQGIAMQNAVHQVSSADTNLATLQETSLPDDAALFSIEKALEHYSDIDMWEDRKYNPAFPIDHGDTVFPDAYISSSLGRVPAVSMHTRSTIKSTDDNNVMLVGTRDLVDSVKIRGAKMAFMPLHGPKFFDSRTKLNRNSSHIRQLCLSLFQHLIDNKKMNGTNTSTGARASRITCCVADPMGGALSQLVWSTTLLPHRKLLLSIMAAQPSTRPYAQRPSDVSPVSGCQLSNRMVQQCLSDLVSSLSCLHPQHQHSGMSFNAQPNYHYQQRHQHLPLSEQKEQQTVNPTVANWSFNETDDIGEFSD